MPGERLKKRLSSPQLVSARLVWDRLSPARAVPSQAQPRQAEPKRAKPIPTAPNQTELSRDKQNRAKPTPDCCFEGPAGGGRGPQKWFLLTFSGRLNSFAAIKWTHPYSFVACILQAVMLVAVLARKEICPLSQPAFSGTESSFLIRLISRSSRFSFGGILQGAMYQVIVYTYAYMYSHTYLVKGVELRGD